MEKLDSIVEGISTEPGLNFPKQDGGGDTDIMSQMFEMAKGMGIDVEDMMKNMSSGGNMMENLMKLISSSTGMDPNMMMNMMKNPGSLTKSMGMGVPKKQRGMMNTKLKEQGGQFGTMINMYTTVVKNCFIGLDKNKVGDFADSCQHVSEVSKSNFKEVDPMFLNLIRKMTTSTNQFVKTSRSVNEAIIENDFEKFFENYTVRMTTVQAATPIDSKQVQSMSLNRTGTFFKRFVLCLPGKEVQIKMTPEEKRKNKNLKRRREHHPQDQDKQLQDVVTLSLGPPTPLENSDIQERSKTHIQIPLKVGSILEISNKISGTAFISSDPDRCSKIYNPSTRKVDYVFTQSGHRVFVVLDFAKL